MAILLNVLLGFVLAFADRPEVQNIDHRHQALAEITPMYLGCANAIDGYLNFCSETGADSLFKPIVEKSMKAFGLFIGAATPACTSTSLYVKTMADIKTDIGDLVKNCANHSNAVKVLCQKATDANPTNSSLNFLLAEVRDLKSKIEIGNHNFIAGLEALSSNAAAKACVSLEQNQALFKAIEPLVIPQCDLKNNTLRVCEAAFLAKSKAYTPTPEDVDCARVRNRNNLACNPEKQKELMRPPVDVHPVEGNAAPAAQ